MNRIQSCGVYKVKTQTGRMISMMKKFGALFVGAALSLSAVSFPVMAQEDIVISPMPAAEVKSVSNLVTVTDIADNYIIGTLPDAGSISLNITDETVVIDSKTADAVSLTDIKKGDSIYTQYSTVMTKSLPPQTNAYLIATNIEEGGGVNLITADEVNKNPDGSVSVTDNSRALIVTIEKDAAIKPYKTKNIVKLQDITAGSKLVAWYDVIALSYPGRAGTKKAVLVSNEPDFENVNVGEWAASDVKDALKLGFLEKLFNDFTKDTTRLDFCTAAYNMISAVKDLPVAKREQAPFTDTSDTKINSLEFAGIVQGKGDGLFAPLDPLTREEAAVILYRIGKYLDIEMPEAKVDVPYSDNSAISGWAVSPIYSLKILNIIKNSDAGEFKPGSNCTVEEAVSAIVKLYNTINK